MKMKLKLICIICITGLTFLHCAGEIYAACNFSATPLSFGNYNVFSTGPLDITSTITINCNENPPPTVTITIGQSTNSGGFDPRAMKLTTGSELLLYNLYIDSNRSTIWGDGTGNTSTVQAKVFKNRPETRTAYGRIPPIQNAATGAYNETLTVTIIW